MRTDPTIIEQARERVASWRRDGSVHPHYCAEWERVLAGEPADVAELLERDSVRAMVARGIAADFAAAGAGG